MLHVVRLSLTPRYPWHALRLRLRLRLPAEQLLYMTAPTWTWTLLLPLADTQPATEGLLLRCRTCCGRSLHACCASLGLLSVPAQEVRRRLRAGKRLAGRQAHVPAQERALLHLGLEQRQRAYSGPAPPAARLSASPQPALLTLPLAVTARRLSLSPTLLWSSPRCSSRGCGRRSRWLCSRHPCQCLQAPSQPWSALLQLLWQTQLQPCRHKPAS